MNEKVKARLGWTVLAVLAAAGMGLYVFAPDLMAAALPILLLVACPLSMLVMMKNMQGNQGEAWGQQPSLENDAVLTREERIDRLRAQQAALAERIDALEREEARPAEKERRR